MRLKCTLNSKRIGFQYWVRRLETCIENRDSLNIALEFNHVKCTGGVWVKWTRIFQHRRLIQRYNASALQLSKTNIFKHALTKWTTRFRDQLLIEQQSDIAHQVSNKRILQFAYKKWIWLFRGRMIHVQMNCMPYFT